MRKFLALTSVVALMGGAAFADSSANYQAGVGVAVGGGVGKATTSAQGVGGSATYATGDGSASAFSQNGSASLAGNAITVTTRQGSVVDNAGNDTSTSNSQSFIVTGESFGDRQSNSRSRTSDSGNAGAIAGGVSVSGYNAHGTTGYAAGGLYSAGGYILDN